MFLCSYERWYFMLSLCSTLAYNWVHLTPKVVYEIRWGINKHIKINKLFITKEI